jgi:hypothetical protein
MYRRLHNFKFFIPAVEPFGRDVCRGIPVAILLSASFLEFPEVLVLAELALGDSR